MTDSEGKGAKRVSDPRTRRKSLEDANQAESTLNTAVGPAGVAYQLMVDSVRDYAIFMLDPNGYVISWNKGAQMIKGYLPHEIIGKHFSNFYPESEKKTKPVIELKYARLEGRFEDEGWRIKKDGSRFWANVVLTAVRNSDGDVLGFVKVTRDLTERKAAEQKAIADARRLAEVETANRAKAEFLAAMSHELRTPLNAIGGYTDLLALGLGGPVTAEQSSYLDRIKKSQQHLLMIISDLLNFSRIEAGQLNYDITTIQVKEIIDTVLPMVEVQAVTRGVHLGHTECPPDLKLRGDRSKVDQILLNLLSNAIKFTSAGGTVRVECASDRDRSTISVIDTGMGIPPEKLDAIFEPFVQLGRSLSSAHEGTGLGLAISRDLARAMNGDLTVTSEVGVGSVFTMRLPAA